SETEVRPWAEVATGANLADAAIETERASHELETKITKRRNTVANYNLPYLSLHAANPKHVALDVFIKMNTSAVRLTPFDIIVAQLEAHVGQSLHDLLEKLRTEVPDAEQYDNPGDLVLNVASLREDRLPGQASYQRLDLNKVADDWDDIIGGIKWAVELLKEERVFDSIRLPSVAVLPVLAALHEFAPATLD